MKKRALILLVLLCPITLHAEETGALVEKFGAQTISRDEQGELAQRIARCAAATKTIVIINEPNDKDGSRAKLLQAYNEYAALGLFLAVTSNHTKESYHDKEASDLRHFLKLAGTGASQADKQQLHKEIADALDICKATQGMREVFVKQLHDRKPGSATTPPRQP